MHRSTLLGLGLASAISGTNAAVLAGGPSRTDTQLNGATVAPGVDCYGLPTDTPAGLTARESCVLRQEGWNTAAVAYLLPAAQDPRLEDAIDAVQSDPYFATQTAAAVEDITVLYSQFLVLASDVPTDGGERDYFTSVVAQALAIQSAGDSGAAAAAAGPSQTGASGAGTTAASPSAQVNATGSTAGAGSSTAPKTSSSSAMAAAGARQTDLAVYAAAGVFAGLAGLAVGL